MRSTLTTILAVVAAGPIAGVTAFTVHLCGDSTMARSGGNTQGWGEYLQYSLDGSKAVVANHAIGGRSARSYTREGRFDEVAEVVQSGDWVVMEFGHNDGGSLANDNGRSACFGDGEETCQSVYNGVPETVRTYPWYLKQAATKMLNKGASVIISEPTPNNVWETGQFSWAPYRFFYYSWLAVSQLGGPAKGVHFVPHGQYSAQAMRNLGADAVNQGYPNDHTHTGPFLADVMAQAFVLGMRCGTSELGQQAVVNATDELSSSFLGPCVPDYNSTLVELLR